MAPQSLVVFAATTVTGGTALAVFGAPVLVVLAAASLLPWWASVAAGAALLGNVALKRPVQAALAGVFQANVALAHSAVRSFQPNVVVASSWGGAIAVRVHECCGVYACAHVGMGSAMTGGQSCATRLGRQDACSF